MKIPHTALWLMVIAAAVFMVSAAEAQQAGTIRTVGILTSRPERSQPLEESLRELGWVEGTTVRFERRFAIDYQELPRLARELVQLPVDVIFTGYSPGVRAAEQVT